MTGASESTYAWADWSVRVCLPLLLEHLGERKLADQTRSLDPIRSGKAAGAAFAALQPITERVRTRFGTGGEHSSAMLMAAITVAELLEVRTDDDADVGWLLSRARYDASRLAEHAKGRGVEHPAVDVVAAASVDEPPAAG